MGECIFCGAVGKLTREHIWADWLKAFIPKDMPDYRDGHLIRGRIDEPPIEEKSRRVGGDPRSKRVECVCGSITHRKTTGKRGCNDGWMSDIQKRIKPTAIRLIRGEDCTLGPTQQRTLAAWIAMSVICGEHDDKSRVAISKRDRTILYNTHAPPKDNWKIWIGRYKRGKWSPHRVHHTLRIVKKETGRTPAEGQPFFNTQSTTYVVGELYIHAISAAWPKCVTDFRFHPLTRSILRQIWPVTDTLLDFPPPRILTDIQAHEISESFFVSLQRAAAAGDS